MARSMVVYSLATVILATWIATSGAFDWEYVDEGSDSGNGSNHTKESHSPGCVLSLVPCSYTITGNLILIAFYGGLLAIAAKMISDGAELLLDLGLPAAIIGGIVLPLLGAVPDSAMIIASGISGSKETANDQISVGMGTLAGSTIMLLTLPWLGSLILGRVDIVHGQGRDNQCSRFTWKSFFKQGVSVFPDVTYSAIVMLITALPYFIVQGADWYFGPTKRPYVYHTIHHTIPGTNITNTTRVKVDEPPQYIRDSALTTCVIAMVLFFLYLLLQVFYSVSSKRRDSLRREEELKRRVMKQLYLVSVRRFQTGERAVQATTGSPSASADETDDASAEKKPLLSAGGQRKYFNAWRMHKGARAKAAAEAEDGGKPEEAHPKPVAGAEPSPQAESAEDPKWKILIKSLTLLLVGVAMVTIFSDPMVGVLTAIADKEHHEYLHNGKRGQYIPIKPFYLSFIITPFCSNASELVSSLMFAAKKKKVNTSLTYSQLYGAATMNNTLCLAIFAALVYFRDLEWMYSAEVTVILFVELVVGVIAIISGFGFKHTYILITGFFVGALYFISILMVYLLEDFANWK